MLTIDHMHVPKCDINYFYFLYFFYCIYNRPQ